MKLGIANPRQQLASLRNPPTPERTIEGVKALRRQSLLQDAAARTVRPSPVQTAGPAPVTRGSASDAASQVQPLIGVRPVGAQYNNRVR